MDKLDQLLQLIRGFLSFNTSGQAFVKTTDISTTEEITKINTTLTDGTQLTQVIPTADPTALTVTDEAVTGSGSIAADALAIEIITSSDFVGTINTVAIPQLAVKTYQHIPGYKYPAINYTISAGTLYISTVQ